MRSLLLLLFIFLSPSLFGQVTFNKRMHFGFPAATLTSIIPSDTGYVAIGILADSVPPYTTSSVFAQFDLEGEVIVAKTLINAEKSYETWEDALLPYEGDMFIAVGQAIDSIGKAILIKYNSEGDTLATKEFKNPFYPVFDWMTPSGGMALIPNGGVVIANLITNAPLANPDLYIMSLDDNWELNWDATFQDDAFDIPRSILVDPEGNTFAGSLKSDITQVLENFTSQTSLVKFSPNGETLWEYLTPASVGLRDAAYEMVLLDDGSLVIASAIGTEIERPTGNTIYFDKLIFKLDSDLEIEWEVTFEDTEPNPSSKLTNIVEVSDGSGFVVAGLEGEDLPGSDTYAVRGFLAKVSLSGETVWTRTYLGIDNNNPRHEIYDLDETPDGGFIICGESRDGTNETLPPQQGWLLKLDGHGCLVPGCHLTDATDEEGRPELELAIYPNPTSDYLNFQLRKVELMKNGIFRIIDAQGSMVREFEDTSQDATYIVPVWEWAAGVYFLQYIEEGVVMASERFVVMK